MEQKELNLHLAISDNYKLTYIIIPISYIMNVIQKGIKINEKYNDAEQYAKKIEGISRNTNWF